MIIYIGADHRGFKLKEEIKAMLQESGYTVVDEGNNKLDPNDDYPDFGKAVAEKVSLNADARGIVICGSGAGVDIVANKFRNIRSVLAISPDHAAASRNDDDTNVLTLAADFLEEEAAKQIVTVWLQTPFSREERHLRRLQKIQKIEDELQNG